MTSHSWQGRVFIAQSLDGFIARPDGDLGWLTDPPHDEGHVTGHDGPEPPPGYEAFMAGIDHLVVGRGTYEKVLTFAGWPYAGHHVIVLGSTLAPGVDERISVAHSVPEVVQTLEGRGARAVYVDGGQVIQEFLRQGLVDELVISTAPVLLGAGIPLFGALGTDVQLTHLGTSYAGSGMTSSRYRVKH
ncbi:MAG TPA: dihydrofolate reductase family protein [Ornithinimicrobium sp.]|uniref:dihydrofolate reductase family protein n=1 Tax=Ornithinimicrobium sp. TaxID=1977084 RepID=UPI002B48F35B|nr:dihydrofolate reductase family protein [Ornithinimicrobium sp.]HKJ12193.1 dihydrofolate reductase family protein [Ornithinimicrobium sp.]